MTAGRAFLIIIVAAICTFATRAFPFVVFGGKKELSPAVRFLGSCLPSAIIATLVIYCLRGITFTPSGLLNAGIQLLSVGIVTVLHLWKHNILLSIGGGTVCYMVLLRVVPNWMH